MRQTTYSFSLEDIAARLINPIPYIEDGYWELVPVLETSSPVTLPVMYTGQDPNTLPGVIIRLVGFRLIQRDEQGPLTYLVKDKYITKEKSNGIDTDNGGSIQGCESPRENS
jgi:hypothetical protein